MTEPVDPSEQGGQPYPPPPAPAAAPLYPAATPPYPPAAEPPGTLGYTPAADPTPAYQPYQAQQPYPGQPQFGPPAPYLGQPYPGQPYPGQPYPGQPYSEQPVGSEPKRRANVKIIVALVTILVAASVAVVAVVVSSSDSKNSSSPNSPLALPGSLGSYQELPGATADRFRSTIGQTFGTSGQLGKFFSSATIGTYGDGGQPPPKLILIAARPSDFPGLRASSIGGGGSLGIQSYPAGSHGGAVDCFDQSIGSVSESICFWSDKQTIGYLVSVNASEDTAAIAALVNTARDTLDH